MPPEPARKYDQNFLSMSCPQIIAETIWDDEVTSESLSEFLKDAPTKPRHIGLAAGYTAGGRLTALAVALGSNVRLVRFRNSRESKDLSPGRKVLQDELLCSADHLFYAFDMAPIALSLYYDQRMRLTGAIDIQSSCSGTEEDLAPGESPRDVARAVRFALSSTASPGIHQKNIEVAFREQLWDDKKSPRILPLRAWLAGFVPSVSDMELRLAEVARINTLDMTEERLGFLAQSMRSDQRLDAAQPGTTSHEFTAVGAKNNKFKVNSERFQTRIQNNNKGPVNLNIIDKYGAQYTVRDARTYTVSGRQAVIKTKDGTVMDDKTVVSIASIGTGGLTMADRQRAAFILDALQGASEALENPFLRTIFPDGKDVVWPEDMPTSDSIPPITFTQRPLNESQTRAVEAMLALDNNSRIVLIQGPPGTGKTTVITAYVHSALEAGQKGIWLVAQSNVAVKNIAEKLADLGIGGWKLLVSVDFHLDWHEHLYHSISRNIIRSSDFKPGRPLNERLKGCKVILCTLSMLSNPRINLFTSKVPVRTVVVDEASQIAASNYMAPLKAFPTIQKMCFIGDDKQLPPYGQEEIKDIQSIFEIPHLRSEAKFLDTQYRMPVTIGDCISDAMYDGQLCSCHKITGLACWFIDVDASREQPHGNSWKNFAESEAVCDIAAKLEELGASYRIISPYDAQRAVMQDALKARNLNWHNKCYNVDSFQGNEDDHIIISLVRSRDLGFLKDIRRTNVMLSRCKKNMYICTSWDFLVNGKGAESLVGRMANDKRLGEDAEKWHTVTDIVENRVPINL